MPHILVADKIAEAGLEKLRLAEQITFDVRHGLSPEELAEAIGEYDGILIRSGVKIVADTLVKPGRLAVIARAGVGVDNVDLDAARARGILVLNTPEANTISTAEHSFAMLLAMHRKIPDANQHVKSGQWKRAEFQGHQLAGRTLGIVGLGRIGLAVAQRALSFEMKVIAHDPFVKQETALDGQVVMKPNLADLLGEADAVTLHAAVPGQSKPLIGKEELAQMKPGGRLINCARGALVDEQALADALSSGHLGGAAIDVYGTSIHLYLDMESYAAFEVACRKASVFSGAEKQLLQHILIFATSFVLLSWCGAVSAVEYYTHNTVSTLIIGVLILSTGIYLRGWIVFLAYASGLVTFILFKGGG